MPFWAARIISGSAALKAAAATVASPAAIASSTLRRNVRMRLRRDRLISVRLMILRAIFLADLVLAIGPSLKRPDRPSALRPAAIGGWLPSKLESPRVEDTQASGRLINTR